MKPTVLTLLIATTAVFAPAKESVKEPKPSIQIALLLDTSNSMDGLINQAKSHLWRIVNDLALAKKNGVTPQLEVALYEYGKSSLSASSGYVRRILPLTTDLDMVSERLFQLTTNGGDEFCGRVIDSATRELEWQSDPADYRAVFIAGNEPFDQGQHAYADACSAAIAKGIVVNTIFCGNRAEGVRTHWKHGADLADGTFITIDQNQTLAHIQAPQDQRILDLGQALNETYLAYGSQGATAKRRQETQDRNAASVAQESAVQRTIAKASVHYKNESWDLVDAVEEDEEALADIPSEALPEPMRDMDEAEREEFVKELAEQRKTIQTELTRLRKARESYVAQKRREQGELSLDDAILEAIRGQATQRQFSFEK